MRYIWANITFIYPGFTEILLWHWPLTLSSSEFLVISSPTSIGLHILTCAAGAAGLQTILGGWPSQPCPQRSEQLLPCARRTSVALWWTWNAPWRPGCCSHHWCWSDGSCLCSLVDTWPGDGACPQMSCASQAPGTEWCLSFPSPLAASCHWHPHCHMW